MLSSLDSSSASEGLTGGGALPLHPLQLPLGSFNCAKNDLKLGKYDLKYYDLKWDFPLGQAF